MVILIILIILIIIATTIAIIIKKHEKFIINNSVTLLKIKNINSRYSFYPLINNLLDHQYDNEKLYANISCEDYLIYELQYKKTEYLKQMGLMEYNRNHYDDYQKEIKSLNDYGKYVEKTKGYIVKLLDYFEKIEVRKYILHPRLRFTVRVELELTDINGKYKSLKVYNFDEDEIKDLIERLKKKNGNFYLDKGIWESICNVERGKVSNKMRFAVYKRDGYCCKRCGRSDRFAELEVDHIQPIAKGGKSTFNNLQTLCVRCNKEKGTDYIKY